MLPCWTVDSGFHSAKLGEHCLGLQSIGLPSLGLGKMNLFNSITSCFILSLFLFWKQGPRNVGMYIVMHCSMVPSIPWSDVVGPRRRAPDAMLGAWSRWTPPRVQWTRNLGPHRVNHHRPGWWMAYSRGERSRTKNSEKFCRASVEFWGFIFWKYGRLVEMVELTIHI